MIFVSVYVQLFLLLFSFYVFIQYQNFSNQIILCIFSNNNSSGKVQQNGGHNDVMCVCYGVSIELKIASSFLPPICSTFFYYYNYCFFLCLPVFPIIAIIFIQFLIIFEQRNRVPVGIILSNKFARPLDLGELQTK